MPTKKTATPATATGTTAAKPKFKRVTKAAATAATAATATATRSASQDHQGQGLPTIPVFAVSHSTLGKLATCPRRAWLHLHGWSRSTAIGAPLVAGGAVHKALDVWYNPQTEGDYDRATDALRKHFDQALERGWQPPEDPDDRLQPGSVERVWSGWAAEHLPSEAPWDSVVESEIPFWVALSPTSPVVVVGYIDLIVLADGQHWVVDHKTTGKIDKQWSYKWKLDAQVDSYVWAARKSGVNAVGMIINGIELAKLPASSRKCKEHGLPYAECGQFSPHTHHSIVTTYRQPPILDQWQVYASGMADEVIRLADPDTDLRDATPSGKWNGQCRGCEFAEFCEVGGTERQLSILAKAEERQGLRTGWQTVEDLEAAMDVDGDS